MSTRCYACCQENCGYTRCTCDCHPVEMVESNRSKIRYDALKVDYILLCHEYKEEVRYTPTKEAAIDGLHAKTLFARKKAEKQ